jgi:hypothetical protein
MNGETRSVGPKTLGVRKDEEVSCRALTAHQRPTHRKMRRMYCMFGPSQHNVIPICDELNTLGDLEETTQETAGC